MLPCQAISSSLQHQSHMLSDRTTLNGIQAYDKESALAVVILSSDKPSTYPEVCLAVVGNC